jgi:hypothetical protein
MRLKIFSLEHLQELEQLGDARIVGNNTKTDLTLNIGREGVDRIHLTENSVQWLTPVYI